MKKTGTIMFATVAALLIGVAANERGLSDREIVGRSMSDVRVVDRRPTSDADAVDPRREIASARLRSQMMIDGGLKYLASVQNADGSFGGAEAQSIRLGLTAIACLAFLGDSNTEYRGRYHANTERAIKFLLSCSVLEGERAGYFAAPGDTLSRMHGHGYATLALAEAYGMFGSRRKFTNSADAMQRALHGAVRIICRSQTSGGGWYYEPFEGTQDEGSITVCMIQALRAARECGFHVPVRTITNACEYIRRSQNDDGSFRYSLFQDERTSFELAAAACSALIHAGEGFDHAVSRGRDWLWGRTFDDFIGGTDLGYPYYGLFYAVQMLWFDWDAERSDRYFHRYYPKITSWFETRFDAKSGSFDADGGTMLHSEAEYGPAYRTAFAVLALEVPYGCLPIFQR